ncbi:hypothetical protein KKD52_18605 [Myxococcota bacterium]|nr:hypothetical protein [Myxococcota bacterium]MBU1413191.1 hypothetical protein [Myxococcota bacterium]MBU1512368.1 hypothetical protein [Myxococcota bacterium]
MGLPSGSIVDFGSYPMAFLVAGALTLAVLLLLVPRHHARVFHLAR